MFYEPEIRIYLRIPESVYTAIQEQAENECRTTKNQIIFNLIKYMEENGKLKSENDT